MTSKVKNELSNSAAAYLHIESMGEAAGESTRALWNAGKYVAEFVNTGGAAGTDETFATFAERYAVGQERKMAGEKITAGSRKQYGDTFKLLADGKVYPRLTAIEKQTDHFVATTPAKARGDRRFTTMAKAVASAIRKGKIGDLTPDYFVATFTAKADKPEATEAEKLASAKAAFVESCIALQQAGLFDDKNTVKLREAAISIGLSVLVPEVAKPAPVPAAPDMAAMMAAFAQFMTTQAAK